MSAREQTLRGQVALVTGAGRGIGRLVAVELAEQGMALGLVGRNRERLEETARSCAEHGVATAVLVADVRSAFEVREAAHAVRTALGPVDLLVNNAGLVDRGEAPFWEADQEHWWEVFETNLRGTVNGCQAVASEMIQRRSGRIVNMSSIFAVRGDIRYSAYSASKASVLALSAVLADSLRENGVHLFDISPGMVRTDMTLGMAVCAGREDWTDPARFVAALVRVAHGELDALAGRFLHVGTDNFDALLAEAGGKDKASMAEAP
ncbi:SDR family oxidoreductase [Streptomyces sp. NPDC005438]|uniref:SDR family NAD(P)-dependent oxidoreductase n=1 Tax=Streptomyces sp. NPDC005438 TaxID=3156880 RepID=UPI0033B61374